MRPFCVLVLVAGGCVCGTVGGGPDGGPGGGGGGSANPGGGGTLETGGGGSATGGGGPQDGGLLPCPVDAGIDGAGVCTLWAFSAFDAACTDGYTRTRSCDGRYDCRTSDHNGCAAGVNVGAPAPPGCPACSGAPGYLEYFGYWRDSDFRNMVCQLQDHVNFSMTNDGQSIVDFAATFGVPNFGLTAPTVGAPAPLQAVVVRDDADASAYGYCAMNPCPNGIIDGWNAVKMQAESDGDAIRAQHPNAHIMINLADGDANGQLDFQTIPDFTLPRGVDWVGLECYTGAASCQANMNVVRGLLPPGGKAWVIAAGVNSYGTEDALVSDAQAMFDWAHADPDVIGIIVFVWSNQILCPPDCMSLAVKQLPNLLAKYRAIGDIITGKTNVDPKPDSACPPP